MRLSQREAVGVCVGFMWIFCGGVDCPVDSYGLDLLFPPVVPWVHFQSPLPGVGEATVITPAGSGESVLPARGAVC